MSDLTYEQMKVLFENLQDRLDKTAGDKLSQEELERIREILDKTQKTIAKNQTQGKSADPKLIINEFFNQWRSNAPLRELTAAQKSGNRGNGPVSSPGNTFIERQLRDRAAAEKATSDTVDKSGKQVQTGFKRAVGGVNEFGGHLNKAGDKISGFVSALQKGSLGGLAGGAVDKVLGAVQDRAENYREMIASGNGQFTSIQQMTNAVNESHMTMQELAKAMNGNSQGTRMLGAADYAKLTGAVTKQTNAIGNMGMNFEQRQELQAAYLDTMVGQGRIRNINENQMVSGILALKASSETTANILGMTRTEALAAQKEQASDPAMANVLAAIGANGDQAKSITDAAAIFQNQFGDVGNKLFKQLTATGTATGEAAEFAATDQQAFRMIKSFADQARSGQQIDQKSIAAAMKSYGDSTFGSQLNLLKGQMSILGVGSPAFDTSLVGARNARNIGSGEIADPLKDPGTNAELAVQEALRASASALREGFDTLLNSISNEYGPQLHSAIMSAIDMATKLQQWLRGWQAMPGITSTIGIAIAGIVGLTGAVGMATKSFSIIAGLGGSVAKIFGGGAAGAAGRGAGAGAGGAGAGAGAAGGTFIQRMRNRMGGTPSAGSPGGPAGPPRPNAGAGAAASGVGKALKGNALIGSIFESIGYFTGEKELSMKNLAKSGLRVGGGAVGGVLGSVGGPLGTIAGGMGGAYAGDWIGNKVFGADDPGSAARMAKARPDGLYGANELASKSATGGRRDNKEVSRPQSAPPIKNASDATGQRSKQALSPEAINTRIMAAQELAVGHLKAMREQGDTLNALVREEIGVMRAYGERHARLLEDANRNTRMIADNAV